MCRSCGSERDHDSPLLGFVTEERRQMRFGETEKIVDGNSKTRLMAQREKRQEERKARPVAQGNLEVVRRHANVWTIGDEQHVAAAQWHCVTSVTRVDKTDS